MLFLYNISLRATVKMSFGCSADCKFNLTIKIWKEEEDGGADGFKLLSETFLNNNHAMGCDSSIKHQVKVY